MWIDGVYCDFTLVFKHKTLAVTEFKYTNIASGQYDFQSLGEALKQVQIVDFSAVNNVGNKEIKTFLQNSTNVNTITLLRNLNYNDELFSILGSYMKVA